MRTPRAVFLVVLGLALGACSGDDDTVFAPAPGSVPPEASSPEGVLHRLEWAINHRSIEVYRELFTTDYQFVFAALDSAGNAYRTIPFTREDEIESMSNLFAAATDIRFDIDRNFNVFADPRPGRDPVVHKNIRTTVSFQVTTSGGDVITCEGLANFFVVREDSASVPAAMQPRVDEPGFLWFIERWEDETYQPVLEPAATTHPQPSTSLSLGAIKVRYR